MCCQYGNTDNQQREIEWLFTGSFHGRRDSGIITVLQHSNNTINRFSHIMQPRALFRVDHHTYTLGGWRAWIVVRYQCEIFHLLEIWQLRSLLHGRVGLNYVTQSSRVLLIMHSHNQYSVSVARVRAPYLPPSPAVVHAKRAAPSLVAWQQAHPHTRDPLWCHMCTQPRASVLQQNSA